MEKSGSSSLNVSNENQSNTNIQINTSISNAELQYMLEGCGDDFRVDGRSCADIRPYIMSGGSSHHHQKSTSSTSALPLSNGSSRVSLPGGTTDILCSTKAEIVRPALLHPDEGIVDINVDYFSPSSSTMNNTNRQRKIEETELSQILSRLVIPNSLSLSSLCIIPKQYCWKISIDVLVLAGDGCVIDAASMAIYKALNDTVLPVVKPVKKKEQLLDPIMGGSSVYQKSNAKDDFIIESGDIMDAITPNGAENCPIVLTVCILQQPNSFLRENDNMKQHQNHHLRPAVMVIDARSEEELCAMAKVCVAVDRNGMICGVLKQGGSGSVLGNGSMPYRMLAQVSDLAALAAKPVFQNILGVQKEGSIKKSLDEVGSNMDFTNIGKPSDFLHGHFDFQ